METTSATQDIRHWRRWAAAGGYLGVLLAATVLRGSDPVTLALYRVTLPWSALSYGATSATFGWFIIGGAAVLNAALFFLIGHLLDQRAKDRRRAA